MGTTDAVSDSAIFLAKTSICVVDVRDNRPKEAGQTSLYQINFEVYKENVRVIRHLQKMRGGA